MIKNYFKTAWRNLWKNKFYSGINIAGLAIGLAVGIMILLWVRDQLSFDRFHKNAAEIYKINSHLGTGDGEQIWDGAPAPLTVFARQNIPEVVNTVRIRSRWGEPLFRYGNKKFVETHTAYVDPSFFSLFDFKLTEGNRAHPFPDMHSVILTASEARKYFGDAEPVGKVITNGKDQFVVSGVVADFPENSSIRYDMLFPMSFYADLFTRSGGNGDWKTIDEDLGNFPYEIFLQLQKGASAEKVAQMLSKRYQANREEKETKTIFFTVQPLTALHLHAADGNDSAMQTVRIFLIVALLILAIACINYVNLATARSMSRSREVSVRKIIGAGRGQLFIQFIVESALLFLLSSFVTFLLIYGLLPLYNRISGTKLAFSLADGNVWLVIGSAITGTLLLAAIYPALLLSSFKPIQTLKGTLSMRMGKLSFRRVLVVTQFVFSVGLIIGTMTISRQLRYIRDKDLGFDKQQVFTFQPGKDLHDHYAAIRSDLLRQPGVLEVSSSDNGILGDNNSTGDTDWKGKASGRLFMIHPNGVDENFIPLLKMKLLAGHNFSGSKADSAHFILNETAVRQTGIKDPIGKRFQLWQMKGTIIGVVKDFNFASLKQNVEPAIFYYSPAGWSIYVKTTGRDASKAIAAVRKVWGQYSADSPFAYSFLDEDFNKMYRNDQRTGTLFNVFALVAILISCLGLLGLAAYTAQVKKKEIGIRKVLGADVLSITRLLVKEFVGLVGIAILIASPVAWWFMHKWLQGFAYRTDIGWWIFGAAGATALLIALLTVSYQAIKAAVANPVTSLRTE